MTVTDFAADRAAELAQELAAGARAAGRSTLLEPEGLALAEALGLATPRRIVVPDAGAVARADLTALPGDEVVVKAVAAGLLHKSERGAVRIVPKAAPGAAAAAMERELAGDGLVGFLLAERIAYDPSFGGELLLGARWTEDFGAIVTVGPGGIHAEHLASCLAPGRGAAILSPAMAHPALIERALAATAIGPAVTGELRGQAPRLPRERLLALLTRFLDFAAQHLPDPFAEVEFNPVALAATGPIALDAVVRLGRPASPPPPPRPLHRLARLLAPRSIAVIGVSQRGANPGRIVVDNILGDGFAPDRLWIVKPGVATLAGCRCVPSVAALPEAVDLLVVSVDAAQAAVVLEDVLASGKAATVILIPGGLGEREGSETTARRIGAAIIASRGAPGGGPLVNGGNCLGIRSVPGRYDSLFIPRRKLRFPEAPPAPLAVLSQSGAFAIARASQLDLVNPRYVVSLGNQIDVTVADFLEHLEGDPEVRVFACYVEGFRPLDGRRFVETAARLRAADRAVVLYRAGRTAAGARASASHTASIAGDYAVARELARSAGALVADSIEEFDDLLRLFCGLSGRRPAGWRLGALSNAGFECVAAADAARRFTLPGLQPATAGALEEILAGHHLQEIVAARNPLDATPILNDEAFAGAAGLVLADPGIDAGVIGCVPLTGALQTLPAGADHGEDLAAEGGVVQRLAALWRETTKPWVAVIDSGALYDPAARALARSGVPVFRSMDRAVRALERWAAWWLDNETC